MFDGKYLDWNQKKIKTILDYYGHKFMFGKKVLDLGCGHADISGVLHRLGADITAVDARQEHLKIASKKYPGIKTVKADLDISYPFIGKSFDLILDLGLICHLSDYEAHLIAICNSTNFLILETTVCDHEDDRKNILIAENKGIYDLSINGVGSRPTATAIERVLRFCGMNFKRIDHPKLNSGQYKYDWSEKNNGECDNNKRRLWFCSKNENLENFVVPTAIELPKSIYTANIAPTLENSKIPIIQSPTARFTTPHENKKIKTALCISGHLRTFEDNYKSIYTNILSKLDCDVFIHTWDTLGVHNRNSDVHLQYMSPDVILDKIQKLYNPKKVIIEKNRTFEVTPLMKSRLLDARDVSGILSMNYKIEACNNLKKQYELDNNIIYDCVIRFRGDIFMEQPLPIDNNFNKNYLYLSTYGSFGGACDQIAFGSSYIMDKYSSLFSNIETHLVNGAPLHPERLLQYHITAMQLPIAKVYIKFLLKRSNGLIQDNMALEKAWGFIK